MKRVMMTGRRAKPDYPMSLEDLPFHENNRRVKAPCSHDTLVSLEQHWP